MLNERLLVHIPFHYTNARLAILRQVIKNFSTYRLKQVDITIDTNSFETITQLASLITPQFIHLNIKVNTHLTHPFDLTWVHRDAMALHLHDYDIFMYLEDDILISWSHFLSWKADQESLFDQGYIRGLTRVERSNRGTAYLTDFSSPMGNPQIFWIDGKAFFQPQYPYCACWIYSQAQMAEFQASAYWSEATYDCCRPSWSKGKGWIYKREKAAFGMTYLPHPDRRGGHRVMLPLDCDRNRLDESALIDHLSGNYHQDPTSHFGKVPVNRIFLSPALWHYHPIYLTLKANRLRAKLGHLSQQTDPGFSPQVPHTSPT